MKNIHITAILVAGFLTWGCGDKNKEIDANNIPAVEVQVSTVTEEGGTPFLSASGKVEAVNNANLSTRMMGYVDRIYADVGDRVKKGQLLLSINNADISARLAQVNAGITEASAAFNNAEKDYKRFMNLFQENSASQKELDDMTANYNMAKARLEGAREMRNEVNAQLSYINIRAPFSGVVTNKFIKEGDMANPGAPLLAMETPGNFQVMAMVPETEILKITLGTEAGVVIKSINETVKGTVAEVSTSATNTGGQYLVKVTLDKTTVPILSGMYATVQFPLEQKTAAPTIMIPVKALVNQGQLSGVFTVSQSNTALLRWLRLGRTVGDEVEVLSGLAPNESYITSAQGKLFNGAKISIQ
ncbi:efflux RND transporter periplasmic adaptor subunit [Muriicola sp.]|uniref:efflux RND transporter periplasmic adaptor subunit n=1 Tax=Muriicola sp. TaxID=2020856 RepID=UPI003C74B306